MSRASKSQSKVKKKKLKPTDHYQKVEKFSFLASTRIRYGIVLKKNPLWRAFSKRSVFGLRFHRVYVWTKLYV